MEVVFENVTKKYGDFVAVDDLNLSITDGDLHFLLGPSGCGKTTSLRMLAGLEFPTSGRILFDGKDVTNLPAAERGIGMVFQNYALWPHMTVRKNIEYGLKLQKMSRKEIAERIDEVLRFTQLTRFVDRYPGQLSGGQQQRVALARALAIRPGVLLLDEPLSNLDAKLRLEMRDNITRIHKMTGITTVYVTHDQKEALSMGSHVSVLRAGRLIQSDQPRRLYHHPATPFIAGFIGETNLVKGRIVGAEGGQTLVDTGFGRLRAGATVADVAEGEDVAVSFRPEAVGVDFYGNGNEGKNPLNVTVDHLTYLGESEQLRLKASDETVLKASVFHAPDHNLSDGDRVDCFVDPSDILIMPWHEDVSAGT